MAIILISELLPAEGACTLHAFHRVIQLDLDHVLSHHLSDLSRIQLERHFEGR